LRSASSGLRQYFIVGRDGNYKLWPPMVKRLLLQKDGPSALASRSLGPE
jgi:hypothetical protein